MILLNYLYLYLLYLLGTLLILYYLFITYCTKYFLVFSNFLLAFFHKILEKIICVYTDLIMLKSSLCISRESLCRFEINFLL